MVENLSTNFHDYRPGVGVSDDINQTPVPGPISLRNLEGAKGV